MTDAIAHKMNRKRMAINKTNEGGQLNILQKMMQTQWHAKHATIPP